MKAIILAAGRSKRMLPLTEEIPKCLLSFGNKTILEYQIGMLKEHYGGPQKTNNVLSSKSTQKCIIVQNYQ